MSLNIGKRLRRAVKAAKLGELSIKRQLVLSLMVVIVPFVLMGIITYFYNMNIVTGMLSESKLHTLGETARNVDQLLLDVEAMARQVEWETTVQSFLSKDETIKNYTDYKTSADAQKVMTKLALTASTIDMLIVVPSKYKSFTSTSNGKGFMSYEDAMQYGWYQKFDKDSDSVQWVFTENMVGNALYNKPEMTFVLPVKQLSSFKVMGHVIVAINPSAFQNIIIAKNTVSDEKVFLIDGSGKLIASSDSAYPYSAAGTLNLDKQISSMGWYYKNVGKEQHRIAYAKLPRYGWQLVSIASVSEISSELIGLSKMMYLVIIVCVMLSLLLAMVLYRGITKPLDVFLKRMQSIAQGDFSVKLLDEGTSNEIKKIYNNFNWMSSRIANLITKNNETLMQKRDAEFTALQAQINPHFLYNVLDTINWMAILKDEDDISRAVTNLSAFYRSILNDGKETVTIAQEIGHVRAYVEIEKLRYKNSFDVVYVLDESLFELITIKFILQPFIENALMHGFVYTKKDNRITIRLYSDGDAVIFEIIDNGEGMTEERVRQVMTEKGQGYGIANVEERIQLKYGDGYGVSILSQLGLGTTVRISIPKNQSTGNR